MKDKELKEAVNIGESGRSSNSASPLTTSTAQQATEMKLRAVIDIGATSVRMVLTETSAEEPRILESLVQSVSLGQDTFSLGYIQSDSIEECVQVLRNFRTLLQEYNLNIQEDTFVFSTSAVAEAENRDRFLDRIGMATGFSVHVLEGNQISRLTYFSILPLLKEHEKFSQGKVLVIEVGGGGTHTLLLENGQVNISHNFRLGGLRLLYESGNQTENESISSGVLHEEIRKHVRMIAENLENPKLDHIILLGGDARLLAERTDSSAQDYHIRKIKFSDLEEHYNDVRTQSSYELSRRLQLPHLEAELYPITLLIHLNLMQQFKQKKFFVSDTTIRQGIIHELSGRTTWTDDFVAQIIHSAYELGARYEYEREHAMTVAKLSLELFDALREEHNLNVYHRTLLWIAAILHDIGTYISPRSHHKHSDYLIRNSALFGLTPHDLNLIALIARYHRKAIPNSTHPEYSQLPRPQRFIVNKLASILRVADALDRSHTSRCRNSTFVVKGDKLMVEIKGSPDITLERLGTAGKSDLFMQVYGKKIVLN